MLVLASKCKFEFLVSITSLTYAFGPYCEHFRVGTTRWYQWPESNTVTNIEILIHITSFLTTFSVKKNSVAVEKYFLFLFIAAISYSYSFLLYEKQQKDIHGHQKSTKDNCHISQITRYYQFLNL